MQPRKVPCERAGCPAIFELGPEPFELSHIRDLGKGKGLFLTDSDGNYEVRLWCERHLEDYEDKREGILSDWVKGIDDIDHG